MSEPRRSVRSTKGQNTKNLDLDQPAEPKRRGRKKKQEEPEEPEEEIIRCVCGATEQTGDSGEPWIACDKCTAWQHNVCVGKSIYDEDLTSEYFCEMCKPEDHKELLDGIARGEKPWEDRRRVYEEESKKKKKGGPKRGAKKRASDVKEQTPVPKRQATPKATPKGKGGTPVPEKKKATPAPEIAEKPAEKPEKAAEEPEKPAEKPEKAAEKPAPEKPAPEKATSAQKAPTPDTPADKPKPTPSTKRKAKEPAEDKGTKLRKVSESQAVPAPAEDAPEAPAPEPAPEPQRPIVPYDPPADLASALAELPQPRQNPAKALQKSITAAIVGLEKKAYKFDDGATTAQRAERLALQVERAVEDTHANAKEYGGQIKTLAFNIKTNLDLVKRLVERTLSPPMLATMTTDELASKELQRETAKMRERAEKQSILITEEGPRVKITHKGEEIIGNDDEPTPTDDAPVSRHHEPARPAPAPAEPEQVANDAMEVELPADVEYRRPLRIDPQSSAKASGFDIKQVFSKVKSPTQPVRRPSQPTSRSPVDDAEVDRLIADEAESPPYSPTDETEDPDVIWRGSLEMPGVATLTVSSKFMGGGNLKVVYNMPWDTLFPSRITVDGRLGKDAASSYLCGMRWRSMFDLVIASLQPTSEAAKPQFQKVVEYFISRKKYGVAGPKALPNVRDMYLIPLLPDGEMPEIMMNLQDNLVPENRTEPMLLIVFVYQNDPEQLRRLREGQGQTLAHTPNTHTNGGPVGMSPITPAPGPLDYGAAKERDQMRGVTVGRQILGEELWSSPSLQYLMPGADKMHAKEWIAIKTILQSSQRARDDLASLTELVGEFSRQTEQQQRQQQQGQQQQGQQQQQQQQQQGYQQQPQQQHQQQRPHATPTPRAQPRPKPTTQILPPKAVAASPKAVPASPKTPSAASPKAAQARPGPISQTPVPIPRIPHTQPKPAPRPVTQVPVPAPNPQS
ncbi:hypothetical protein RB598_007569 [Gaeumannomyces tritici]